MDEITVDEKYFGTRCINHPDFFPDECGCKKESIVETYAKQMAEQHALEIDKNFWLVVKKKPKYMPSWLYKAVIKELVNWHQYK